MSEPCALTLPVNPFARIIPHLVTPKILTLLERSSPFYLLSLNGAAPVILSSPSNKLKTTFLEYWSLLVSSAFSFRYIHPLFRKIFGSWRFNRPFQFHRASLCFPCSRKSIPHHFIFRFRLRRQGVFLCACWPLRLLHLLFVRSD